MKGFVRATPQVSLCGLNCLLCPMHIGGHCPGCGGGEGNQSCAIARCAMERGVTDFCGRCEQYPCGRYQGLGDYDSFVPKSRINTDMARVLELGVGPYVGALEEKRAVLDQLLADWNDGRKKTLYTTAAYLLELEDLRGAVSQARAQVSQEAPLKERATAMAAALQETAARRGISLKLRKKPKKI